jgi:RNA polymerase sigma-70 factor (ECF subfamily)
MPPKPDRTEPRLNAEDVDLAQRCQRGDEDAQRTFVHRLGTLAYSVCRRSGLVEADCDDVSQQIMLDAFKSLPAYRGTSRLSTWVYSLALRRVADYFRSQQRREVPFGSPGGETFPVSPSTTEALAPDEQAVKRDEDRRVTRAVARLPEPERGVILAYYLGEMSVLEIARVFNIPEGTVKTRLHRGRRLLRQELGES